MDARRSQGLRRVSEMDPRDGDAFDWLLQRSLYRDERLQACRHKLAVSRRCTGAVVVDVEALGLWRVVVFVRGIEKLKNILQVPT